MLWASIAINLIEWLAVLLVMKLCINYRFMLLNSVIHSDEKGKLNAVILKAIWQRQQCLSIAAVVPITGSCFRIMAICLPSNDCHQLSCTTDCSHTNQQTRKSLQVKPQPNRYYWSLNVIMLKCIVAAILIIFTVWNSRKNVDFSTRLIAVTKKTNWFHKAIQLIRPIYLLGIDFRH